MHPDTDKLLCELESWCAQARGRQSQVARILGVSAGTVNDWIRRRRMPSLDQGNQIKAILRRATEH